MHALSFLQKRTHLCAVARGREMFARVPDMTPARFDFLHVIYKGTPAEGILGARRSLLQADVTHALGLARQTVWKMVERLVEIGWLVKSKLCRTQLNVLTLTDEGIRRVRQALNAAFTESAPLPRDAPANDTPRYWRRPELADPPPPRPADCVTEADIQAAIEANRAFDALWNELSSKLPKEVPRPPPPPWAPLPKLTPLPPAPQPVGREVEKIFTAFAFRLLDANAGRRGRRAAHLRKIDELVVAAEAMASALGNVTPTIYTNRFMRERYC